LVAVAENVTACPGQMVLGATVRSTVGTTAFETGTVMEAVTVSGFAHVELEFTNTLTVN
jgi:hypothetical protein